MTGLYIGSKVVLVITNIVYLAIARLPSDPSLSPQQERGRTISYYITFVAFIHEIVSIVLIPTMLACCWNCWKITSQTFCEYFRYYDLQFALTYAPFASVHLHYLGGPYWIFILIRVGFYCTTFVAVVILGVRFFIAIYCFKVVDIACCSNGEAVEIKGWKHLLKDVGLQLFGLMTKVLAGSSALATFFKIGLLQSDPVMYAYLAFTLLICVNAMASLMYNAVLLRWIVMKEDNKADDSIGSKSLNFLKFKAPSSHISFAISLCTYCGLIGLDSYILNSGNFR